MTMAHKKRTIENLNKIQPLSNQVPEQHVQDNFPADIETAFDQNSDYERETDEEFQNVHTRPASIADISAFAVSLISSNAIMTLPSNQLTEFDIESTDTGESFNEFAPSAPESTIDDEIRVPSRPVRGEISDFCLALGLWCDKEGIKRRTYDGLLEVLQLLDTHEVRNLPKRLSTLHSWCRKRLPIPSIQKAAVLVRREKQPTGTPRPAQANVYYFDARIIISILLSATTQRNIHIDMAEIVDSPSEYWHSNSWGSSIRTCSTDFARFPHSSPILPSDIVQYRCGNDKCGIIHDSHCGQVIFFGRDQRSRSLTLGQTLVRIRPLISRKNVNEYSVPVTLDWPEDQLLLIEDADQGFLSEHVLARRFDVAICRNDQVRSTTPVLIR